MPYASRPVSPSGYEATGVRLVGMGNALSQPQVSLSGPVGLSGRAGKVVKKTVGVT